jgi:ABC-type nickel/cobalt efflux system permease component RcnA
MEVSLLSILAFGFVLGIKHAIEPDHIIAVSTIASRSKKIWSASLAGAFWGMGHTATLFVVGMSLILMKVEMPEKWAMSFEFFVGIMLVYFGIHSILSFSKKKLHSHEHKHNEGEVHKHFHAHEQSVKHEHAHRDVSYLKSMIIGVVHGLAGSAAMVLLTMSTMASVWQGAIYILIFGMGTVAGMLVTTTIIGMPFVFTVNKIKMNHTLIRVTGAFSIAFGLYYMFTVGITDGLVKLWIQ